MPSSLAITNSLSYKVGLILRTDAFSFAQYTLCLIHDPVARCTTGVCIGLRLVEYQQFTRYITGSLHSASVRNPLFLPMVLLDFMKQSTARWLSYNRMSLLAIANSKEINVREYDDDRGFKADQKLDLDAATRKLTFLNDEFSITESISKTHLRFLDVIEEMLLEQKNAQVAPLDDVDTDATNCFLDELSYLRESFKSAIQYVERDRSDIQGLAQTVSDFIYLCFVTERTARLMSEFK